MYAAQGHIRDYDHSSDTATVELDGLGVIDAWVDGITIDASLNRSQLVHGAPVTLLLPDRSRICEAIITAIGDVVFSPVRTAGATLQRTETGRVSLFTDGFGAASAAITYAPAFSAVPNLTIQADNQQTITPSAMLSTGFTIAVSGGPINDYVLISWHAQGNA